MIIIDLKPASDYDNITYGITAVSTATHQVTGARVLNPEFGHVVKVWRNEVRHGGAYMYVDPRGYATNDKYSVTLTSVPTAIVAGPGQPSERGADLMIGRAEVRLRYPDGTVSGEFEIRTNGSEEPYLAPVGDDPHSLEEIITTPVRHDMLSPIMVNALKAIADRVAGSNVVMPTIARRTLNALAMRKLISGASVYKAVVFQAGSDWLRGAYPAPAGSVRRELSKIGMKFTHLRTKAGWRLSDFGIGCNLTADFDNDKDALWAIRAVEEHLIKLGYMVRRPSDSARLTITGRR